nr:hypothetical protein [Gemmatimonadaceae bacterium]
MREEQRDHRTRRVTRVILGFVVAPIVLGALIVLLGALTPWGNERVRQLVVSRANGRLTGTLAIGRMRGNLFTGVEMTDVRITDSAHGPVFTARRARVRYAVLPLIRGRVVLQALELDTPFVVLDRPPNGRWNFQSLLRPLIGPRDTSRHGVPPEIANVVIRHGRMLYRRPWRPDSSLAADRRDAAIAAALAGTARSRTERVQGGYQRVLDYHDIEARIGKVELASRGAPTSVRIDALSMIAEPYRPPVIDVRSLVGTLYASKDSLWWRNARMGLPASNVTGDGTIGFRHSGFRLDLRGSPVALADLRWLNPKLPLQGGGRLHYTMRLVGDTADYAVRNADVRYRDARIAGDATVSRVHPRGSPAQLTIRDADLTVARLTTDVLHELAPSVVLRRRGTIDGHLAVTGPPRALEVNADLTFVDVEAGRSHVSARGGVGFDHGVRARDLAVTFAPLQLATVAGAGVKLPLRGTLNGAARITGAVRDGWTVRGDLTHVERGARSRVVGDGRYAVGSGRLSANAQLLPLSLATVGRFVPSAGLQGSVTGRVTADGTVHDLTIAATIRSTRSGGSLDAHGTVALRGSRTRYDVTAVADALDARAFSSRAPRTLLSGHVVARGTGVKPATATAFVNVDLARSRYDTFSVEALRARARVNGGLLRLDTLLLAEGGARASASGTLGLTASQRGTLRFTLDVDSLGALRRWIGTADGGSVAVASGRQRARLEEARVDSARRAKTIRIERLALGLPEGVELVHDTLPAIRRDSLAGALRAAGVLRGNVKELGVEATLRGTGLVARGAAVHRLLASVASSNVRDRRSPLSFRADAESVQVGGYGFERIAGAGSWRDRTLVAELRVRQDSLVSYATSGSYAHPSAGAHLVRLDSLRGTFDTLVWRLAHPAGVRVAPALVSIDSVDLRSSVGGRLFANGTVPAHGAVRLDAAAENVRVSTVLAALQRDLPADGVLAASATLTGTRAAPGIDARVTLRDARYGSARAPDADVGLRYLDQRVAVDAVARDSTGHRVLIGTASLPLELALERVSGSRRLPGAIVADVSLDSLALSGLPLRSRAFEGIHGIAVADATARGTWR